MTEREGQAYLGTRQSNAQAGQDWQAGFQVVPSPAEGGPLPGHQAVQGVPQRQADGWDGDAQVQRNDNIQRTLQVNTVGRVSGAVSPQAYTLPTPVTRSALAGTKQALVARTKQRQCIRWKATLALVKEQRQASHLGPGRQPLVAEDVASSGESVPGCPKHAQAAVHDLGHNNDDHNCGSDGQPVPLFAGRHLRTQLQPPATAWCLALVISARATWSARALPEPQRGHQSCYKGRLTGSSIGTT